MPKMKMVALLGRKRIIPTSISLRKSCLGSKLGDSRFQKIHSHGFQIDTYPEMYSFFGIYVSHLGFL